MRGNVLSWIPCAILCGVCCIGCSNRQQAEAEAKMKADLAEAQAAAAAAQQAAARMDRQLKETQRAAEQVNAQLKEARETHTVFRPEFKAEPTINIIPTPAKKAADIILRSVEVYSTDANGAVWDESGPPDLKVYIRNQTTGESFTSSKVQDSTSAEYNQKAIRVNEGDTVVFKVIDADVFDDDTIGTYSKEFTERTLALGTANWSFGRVASLVMEFQP
jgi:hypothetical protein